MLAGGGGDQRGMGGVSGSEFRLSPVPANLAQNCLLQHWRCMFYLLGAPAVCDHPEA